MTSLNLLERMNELSDGVIRPFNATREGRRGSISEIPAEMEDIMRQTLHFFPIAMLSAVAAVGSAFAADLPKEGAYDFTACWSGVSNAIAFSKTHTASSWEITGATRSNPSGGMFDNHSFRCVGINYALDGKAGGTAVCEAVDRDGDKRLTFFSTTGDKVVRENVTGTGKYEGMIASGTVQPLGPFPVIKPGTFQNCNHQTGSYKLR